MIVTCPKCGTTNKITDLTERNAISRSNKCCAVLVAKLKTKFNHVLQRRWLQGEFRGNRLVGILIIIYLLFITFPGRYAAVSTGLDNSWQYGINFLPQSHYVWGQDVAFVYGPLGYLAVPLDIGHNLTYSVALWVILHCLFAIILFYLLFKSKSLLPILLFAVAYTIMYFWGFSLTLISDLSVPMIIGVLFYFSLMQDSKISYGTASLGALLAGLSLFIKFNIGLASLTMLIVFGLIWIIRKRRRDWQIVLVTMAVYLLTVILLAKVNLHSYHNFAAWIRYSFNLANGYGSAMSIVGPKIILVGGLLVLVVYLVLTFLLLKKRSNLGYVAIMFIIPVFLAFKEGFCRQDVHVLVFFLFILAVLSILILYAADRRELITGAIGFLVVLILALPALCDYNGYIPNWHPSQTLVSDVLVAARSLVSGKALGATKALVAGETGWSNIDSAIHLGAVRVQLDEQSQVNLQADRLPQEWLNAINKNNSTVDVLPWEIAYCPANDLRWNPNPLLQTYSAYTALLDQWSASHYEGNRSPDFLIVEFEDIDGRHPLLSTPATWQNIVSNYELSLKDLDQNRLLLGRKAESQQATLEVINCEDSHTNQWISVPPSSDLLFVDVDMKLTTLGTVMKALFRIPPVYIDLLYDSGSHMSYRIIPDTAANGILVNFLPTNAEGLSELLTGVSNDRAAMFQISGPGTAYYDNSIRLTWKEMPQTVEYNKLGIVKP